MKNFIDGIYNYCDRWCERCTFTSRCRNYAHTSKLNPEQQDSNNKAFWDEISNNMQTAIQLLKKAAEEYGFDLNKPLTEEEEEAYQKRESFLKSETRNHVLSKLCKQYQKVVMPFCEKPKEVHEKAKELTDHLNMGIASEQEVKSAVASISDCFEIIQWYLFFIDAKLQRALRGKLEGEKWEEENGFQKDSEGSAKIAIIAIERSKSAWIKLYELMPASEDTALKSLAVLEQMHRTASLEFPKAMEFKRPGFDD